MRQATITHVWSVTEYERGWGQRPDGYYVAREKTDGIRAIRALEGDRSGPVPDCYESYTYIGEKEIGTCTRTKLESAPVGEIVWVKNYQT